MISHAGPGLHDSIQQGRISIEAAAAQADKLGIGRKRNRRVR
jgi:hypothetical protein